MYDARHQKYQAEGHELDGLAERQNTGVSSTRRVAIRANTPFVRLVVDLGRGCRCSGHVAIGSKVKDERSAHVAGVIYGTIFLAVAVWIGLMLFTRRSAQQRWSVRYENRLRQELGALQGGRLGANG